MPNSDDAPLTSDDVLDVVAHVCFPPRPHERTPGQVGLEVERFPVLIDDQGQPAGRLLIEDAGLGSLDVLGSVASEGALGARTDVSGVPSYPVPAGGRVTFEPGGALEHASAVHPTAAAALDEQERVGAILASAFDERGAVLASVGVDPWHDVADIPLQLDCFRYPAMAEYLDRRGDHGRVIMRHTCSIQINLDLGPEPDRRERWALLNFLSPLLTATFANSPDGEADCSRALAWQGVDPTRSGFPPRFLDGSIDDPVEQMADMALAADVLLVRHEEGAVPGRPGWTFGEWLRDGDPEHGRPTVGDLIYHLSTVFSEVRPRGMFEVRSVDALPRRWRSVPVTLLVGALEDGDSRSHLLGLLARHRAELPALWRRAARDGVGDPSFCALAVEVWSYAMQGAGRLPRGYLDDDALPTAEAFLERYTLRGACPADELRELCGQGAAAALAWVAEPVPQRARRPGRA